MKLVLRYIAVVMACVGLAGCGSRTVDARLAQVNDLANAGEADSAIVLLQAIEKTALDEYNSRYHDLMAIKTRDKTDADITGDTAIVDIMAYFEAEGPDEVRGEAFYYGGRVYREMGDAPQALDYYQKAQDAFPQDHAFMKGKIASQMGQIFLDLYMHEHAKSKFQEAITYQKECSNTIGIILDLRMLGDVFQELNMLDSALYCYKQALALNDKSDLNLQREVDIRSSIVDLFIYQKEYDKARQEFVEFDKLSSNFNYDYVLYTKINMHIINENYTKAISLAHQLKQSQSLRSRIFAYSILLDYSKALKNYKSVYHYAIEHNKCIDSLNLQASANAVINQNSLYNYTIKEQEKFQLEKTYLNSTIFYLSTILILDAVIVFFIYVYRLAKKRNRKLFIQNNKLEFSNKELISDNERMKISLTQHLDKINNLENLINQLKNDTTKDDLSEKIQEQIINRIRDIDLESYQVNCTILESDVYATIRNTLQKESGITTDEIWKQLDEVVNTVYPNFKIKLYYLYSKLNDSDYRMCLLIKCKFTINEIALLTFRGKNAIINRRTRLYFKLFGVKGSAIDLDRYILSL